ncbi:hypothetical protein GCM10023333_34150 [Ferrimonas pelagia]|uniref:Uncharacterized protein n=2 Tax=Ferrimonas pelagia TaxID=1177826 RepID=A0ABP9FE74_9GAMM
MHGTGQGHTPQRANSQALKAIASQLKITISAQSESRINIYNGQLSERHQQIIKTKVPPLPIEGYTEVKTINQGGVYYAHLKITRDRLARGLTNELQRLDTKIANLRSLPDSDLSLLAILVQHHQSLLQASQLIDVIELLGYQTPSVDNIDWATNELPKRLREASVALIISGASEDFHLSLQNWITDAGLAINSDSSLATIHIEIKPHDTRYLFSQHHRKVDANLKVYDANDLILTEAISKTGVSSLNGELAKVSAELQLLKQLQEHDVWHLLTSSM